MSEKLTAGLIIGGVLGILAMFGELQNGERFVDAFWAIPIMMVVTVIATFWFTRDKGDEDMQSVGNSQIQKLQHELMRAAQAEADYVGRGMHSEAVYWHSRVITLESQLRQLGA